MLELSEETKRMLKEGRGFRCESYGGSGKRKATDVIPFEVRELDNYHIAEDVCKALGFSCKCWEPEECDESLKRIEQFIIENFGPGAQAVWVGTREAVVEHYCQPDEQPDEMELTEEHLVISDLGDDGALVLMPAKRFTKLARELVAQQRQW
jgi:hypothetical protein